MLTIKEKITQSKKPFLSVCFATSTDRIYANVATADSCGFSKGDYVLITGSIGEYNGSAQLNISTIEKAYGLTFEPRNLSVSLEELMLRFYNLVNSVPLQSESGQLLNRILDDKALIDKYFDAPVAI